MSAELENAIRVTALSLGRPTVSELVDKVVKDKGLKSSDVTRAVYVMWKKGALDFSHGDLPFSFWSYSFGLENLWFWGLSALVTATVLAVFLVNGSFLVYVRYVLGGIFILFLPGAVLLTALYPRAGEMDGLERLALSIGLSLAIVPLVGLGLNYTPWGIRLEPIMISLAVFAEVMGVVCVVRRFRYYQLDQG